MLCCYRQQPTIKRTFSILYPPNGVQCFRDSSDVHMELNFDNLKINVDDDDDLGERKQKHTTGVKNINSHFIVSTVPQQFKRLLKMSDGVGHARSIWYVWFWTEIWNFEKLRKITSFPLVPGYWFYFNFEIFKNMILSVQVYCFYQIWVDKFWNF